MALSITELRKSRDQGWHSYLRDRVRSKAGVVSKALISQPECSFAKGVAEHVKKKKNKTKLKRHNLVFVSAQDCALQPTVDLAADSRWEGK